MNTKASEFLAEIKAGEELKQRGYEWISCDWCSGRGSRIRMGSFLIPCKCLGRGGRWIKNKPSRAALAAHRGEKGKG
jgi:hypothetical protein